MRTQTLILLAAMLSWCPKLVNASPTITNVSCPGSVARYDKLEITFNVSTVATNYYWPYDTNTPPSIQPGVGVTVDGLFSIDNWATTITVPAFYYQDYSRRLVTGTGKLYTDEADTPVGQPHWRLRFAPTQTGTWRYKIRVTDSSGTTTYPASGDSTFTCSFSNGHGFVRVSPTDPRYFELSDGTPIVSPGVNAQFHTTYEADTLLQSYGANGVRTARWWINYREWQNPFAGGGAPVGGGAQWNFFLTLSTQGGHKSGDRYCAKLIVGKDTRQYVYLTAGVSYRFTGYIKTDAVVAPAGQGIIPYVGSAAGTAITGTCDWTAFTVNITPGNSGSYLVGVKHTGTAGTGYFDDLSLKSTTDGGATWSGEYLSKPDFEFQNYVDLKEAWKVDRIFEAAKLNGVYLKTVLTEKDDTTLGCINADGSTGVYSINNFFASATHPSRWLQKAWWRYATARWSAYSSLHSWELCNEGDPFAPNHYDAANALANYMHGIDPNRHLCTTSFWHSIPMEFWKTSACDYIDLHEYVGPAVGYTLSHGPRFHAWYDGHVMDGNDLLPLEFTGGDWSIDDTTSHSGSRSTKVVAHDGALPGDFGTAWVTTKQYHVGIDPSHRYTCRFWAKAENVGNQPSGSLYWAKPGIYIIWSKTYHENDFVEQRWLDAKLGTYDWTQFSTSGIAPLTGANTVNISINCSRSQAGSGDGIFWVDDIEFIDETTGEHLFVDGEIERDRIDYDSALATRKYGILVNSYGKRVGKPGMWAETGIRGENIYGSPYKGYTYVNENQQLVDDTAGIYLKKMVWGHVSYDNPTMLVWWTDIIIGKNLWHYFKAFQDFIRDVPLSNGRYVDAAATTDALNLRAWGQKDLTSSSAILWVDNAKHTWKNVVDGVTVPPVSGTVTIRGLRNGDYKIQWWNTSTGTAEGTPVPATCTGGVLTFTVTNLADDKACKITLSETTPPVGSVIINSGDGYARSTLATLTLLATDPGSGVALMRFSNDGSSWSAWGTYQTSKLWDLSSEEGTKTVYAQFEDGAGNHSPIYNDSIVFDTTQPSGTIAIGYGVSCVNSPAVLLALTGSDAISGVAQMRFSNDGILWSEWENFRTTKDWMMTTGDGTKTVYAQLMDAAGNLSDLFYDTVMMEVLGPEGSITISSGATYATSASVVLTLCATDAGCGVHEMRLSNDGSTWTDWELYRTSKDWTLSPGDGSKVVSVQYEDGGGNLSIVYTDGIIMESSLPEGSIIINSGDASTNATSVTLTLSATDAGSGISEMRFSNDDSIWSAWEGYGTSKAWTLTSGDADKTVYAQFKDVAGNVGVSSDSIELRASVPGGSIIINSGAAYTGSTSVTLTLSDSGGGAVQMRFSNDGASWTSWETYRTTKSWTLSSGDGTKNAYVQFKNNVGTILPSSSDTIVLDTGQPTGSVLVNSGDPYTASTSVTLTLSATDGGSGVSQMRFSNDNSTWSAWETYQTSKAWTLSSSSGTRTVYVQFKDGVGNNSPSRTDTIVLDTTPPNCSVNINSGAQYATSTSVTLTLSASDSLSGVSQMRCSNDGSTWSAWAPYQTSQSWTLTSGDGLRTVYAQFKDGAGNASSSSSDTITLATNAPTGSVVINSGVAYTKITAATLTLSATGGVSQMRFSNNASTWSSWESYKTSKSWTLTSGDGTKTVYAQFKDAAGSISENASDTIILKTSIPVVTILGPTSDTIYRTNYPSYSISGSASSDVTGLAWSTDHGQNGVCAGTTSWSTGQIPFTVGANVITITASDAAGTQSTDSLTVEYYDATIPSTWIGLVMVSVPLIPDENDPKLAVGFDQNSWCTYMPLLGNYVVYWDDPGFLTWFVPPESAPGRGFWARFAGEERTPLGQIPRQDQPASIHLYPGWNMMGQPFLSPVKWSISAISVRPVGGATKSLKNSRNAVEDYAFGWNPSIGQYYLVYDSTVMPGVDDTLDPWMAYWIKAYKECDLIIPAP